MPVAPTLPPEQMAQAQAGQGLNPANFLIAAADMHGAGQLADAQPSAPGGPKGQLIPRRPVRKLKVIK